MVLIELDRNSNSPLITELMEEFPRLKVRYDVKDRDVSFPGGIEFEFSLRRLAPESSFPNLLNPNTKIRIKYFEDGVDISFIPESGVKNFEVLNEKLRKKPHVYRVTEVIHLVVSFLKDETETLSSEGEVPRKVSRLDGDYELSQEPIGSGSAGHVYKATNRIDKIEYAIKEVMLLNTKEEKEAALREVELLAMTRHKNIVGYHCAWMNDRSTLCICMELCESTLLDWLKKSEVEDDVRIDILKQLGEAVCFLHEKGIIHRDLSSTNILMDKHNVPKVCDFNLAVKLEKGESTFPWLNVGQSRYKPPEMTLNKGNLSKKIDIFSLGLVFLEVWFSHLQSLKKEELNAIFSSIREGVRPAFIDDDRNGYFSDLLDAMLNVDPEQRMNASEVLSWLGGEDSRKRRHIQFPPTVS